MQNDETSAVVIAYDIAITAVEPAFLAGMVRVDVALIDVDNDCGSY